MGSSSHEGRLFDKTTPRPLCTKGINKHSRVTKDKRERLFSVASREDESNKMWCAFSGTKERKPRLVGESSTGHFSTEILVQHTMNRDSRTNKM